MMRVELVTMLITRSRDVDTLSHSGAITPCGEG